MRVLLTILSLLISITAYAEKPDFAVDMPDGFSIEIFADDLPGARSMVMGDEGTLFVGSRGAGNVYAVRDTDGDGTADKKWVIAEGLNSPNGTAFRNGSLYIGEIHRIIRFDNIEDRLDNPPEPVVVYDELPNDDWHGWKYISFGPDGRLYIPVGAPCNVCDEGHPFAALHSIKPDGTDFRTEATGIRNTVGFDWNPKTGTLWFTDNGRDWLGDTLPPDELNRIKGENTDFGYPYCYGDGVKDPAFSTDKDCTKTVYPQVNLTAHVAALGMKFYDGDMFPEEYRGGIFFAMHGSWNRSTKVGYKVYFVKVENDKAVSHKDFATGWLDDGYVNGRPVDIFIMPDGSMLVSDDKAGQIYRIEYGG
ncbi:PQQ-dependent sugar dehydrogenase [Limisalsivibrio acetivorans]|uniref:PQQ-dependent sugar dehydrogenase n=1 Tax=Limisalsivibrio acetivorans TaxID=1304888 RepID=UPI0009DB7580|nr:PQQ-dependent sugar dehydrogenase [Limisalsivibrio acetivorans]